MPAESDSTKGLKYGDHFCCDVCRARCPCGGCPLPPFWLGKAKKVIKANDCVSIPIAQLYSLYDDLAALQEDWAEPLQILIGFGELEVAPSLLTDYMIRDITLACLTGDWGQVQSAAGWLTDTAHQCAILDVVIGSVEFYHHAIFDPAQPCVPIRPPLTLGPASGETKTMLGGKTLIESSTALSCNKVYDYVSKMLGDDVQTIPGSLDYKERVLSRIHRCTDEKIKAHILDHFVRTEGGVSKALVGTSLVEHGLDFVDVVRVIHAGAPGTIESYLQGVGRGGRRGQHVFAVLYYNGNDFSKGRSNNQMKMYCENTTRCRREMLKAFFKR